MMIEQVHSLCVDSRPGDRLRLVFAKGPCINPCIIPPSFCQCEAHSLPSAMAVRKISNRLTYVTLAYFLAQKPVIWSPYGPVGHERLKMGSK